MARGSLAVNLGEAFREVGDAGFASRRSSISLERHDCLQGGETRLVATWVV